MELGFDASSAKRKLAGQASGPQKSEKPVTEKSLPLAIGLNFIFPGLGYFYLGDIYRGILGAIIVPLILISSPLFYAVPLWFSLNILLAIDMVMLHKKIEQKLQAQNMKPCPYCAELILKQAKRCKHCGSSIDS